MAAGEYFIALASVYRYKGGALEFLVIKRVPEDGDFWQPVTGGIEPGETPRQAIMREVAEEIGISDYLHVSKEIARSRWWDDDWTSYGTDILHAVEVAHDAEVMLSHEHEDHRWLPLEEATLLLKYENNRDALQKVHHYATQRLKN